MNMTRNRCTNPIGFCVGCMICNQEFKMLATLKLCCQAILRSIIYPCRDENKDKHTNGLEGQRRSDGVPLSEPSIGLPNLWSRRRMWPPRPVHGVWFRQRKVYWNQALCSWQEFGASCENCNDTLHTVHQVTFPNDLYRKLNNFSDCYKR